MYKTCSFISLLFFSHIMFGMEQPLMPKRPNGKLQYNKQTLTKTVTPPTIPNSLKSSGITKSRKTAKKQQQQFSFIYDKYTARRGTPKMICIHCDDCGDLLIKYQKDGPGKLLRCYLDRIHSPQVFKNRQYEQFNVRTAQNLSCQHCRLIIGTPMIYQSERRPAYKMKNNTFYIREN